MKKTLSTEEFISEVMADDCASWSYQGARALAEYLQQLEEDTGQEIEMDVVALRCDFSEYPSLVAWAEDTLSDWKSDLDIGEDDDEEEIDDKIREYIHDNGQLVEFKGGVIVSNF